MNLLYASHSGLRFLVLLAGLFGVALCVLGLARKRPFDKSGRIAGAVFSGLLDTQALLGLSMMAMGRFSGALLGHLAVMLTAAVVAHVFLIVNRRRAEPNWLLPLYGIGGALGLIVLGTTAIGRSPLQMTPFAG